MKLKFSLWILGACGAGILCGVLICGSIPCRKVIGRLFGRGELIALVHGSGIYEFDVTRGVQDSIAAAVVGVRSCQERIAGATIDREYELLKSQLLDEVVWAKALRTNRLCSWTLRRDIAKNLRAERWLERQLASQIAVGAEDCREYFNANQAAFSQPIRFRAAHLFLAAPPETAEEIVDVKRRTIEELSARLKRGEKFSDLVAQFSEDEATKKRGGDLGYFSQFRMPADFMDAIRRMHVGETSPVIQTKLGFHIIQLTDVKEVRQMGFDEAQREIVAQLENARRRSAVQRLTVDLSAEADFVR